MQRLAHGERGHRDLERAARGHPVVGLTGWQVHARFGVGDLALEDLVVQVGPHDHAPVAVFQRRQLGFEAAAVLAIATHIAHMGHLAQQGVAQIPLVVGRQVQRVGPAAIRRVDRGVADGECDVHLITHLGAGRQHHVGDLQVGRRWGFDAHGLHGRCVVVVVLAKLQHLAGLTAAPDAGRVGDNKNVVRPFQIARCGVGQAAGVAATGLQATAVLHIAQVAVFVQVEKAVFRQVDHVVPGALVGRCFAAQVVDLVVELEVLPGNHRLRRGHLGDLQIGRCGQQDRQVNLRGVVGLVLELQHPVAATFAQHRQAAAHGAGHLGIKVSEHAGIGLDDQLEIAADRGGYRKRGALGVALAGLQIARLALVVGQVNLARAQQHFNIAASVYRGVVTGVKRGVA